MKKFKRILLFIQDNYISLSLILFSLIMMIFVIPKLENNINKYHKNYYLEKGRIIGRNSMLEYLHNNNKLKNDTLNIDIQKLLKIEEKNQENLLNKKED